MQQESPYSFNSAVREAIGRRDQWMTPIAIWMFTSPQGDTPPTEIRFEAYAATIRADDQHVGFDGEQFMELDQASLDQLAVVLDCDPKRFDEIVTDILSDNHDRRA